MDDVLPLASLIANASAILVVTGAGISTSSGIPDYRGPDGVWKTQKPVEFHDFVQSEQRRIDYWEQKLAVAPQIGRAEPAGVHEACVLLEAAGKLESVVTQNIDGLHTLAGLSSANLVEVHGTALEAMCLDCGDRSPIAPHLNIFSQSRVPPRCTCGGLLKPATISFGQSLDPLTVVRATQAADACDLVLALGTTLSVYPAADIPLRAARRGVPYVVINQGSTDHDGSIYLTLRLHGDVSTVFPRAVSVALAG